MRRFTHRFDLYQSIYFHNFTSVLCWFQTLGIRYLWWFSQHYQQTKTLSCPQFLDHLLTGIECICGHYGHHHWKDKYDFLWLVFLWWNSICVLFNCPWAEGDWMWSGTKCCCKCFVVQRDRKSVFSTQNPAVAVVTSPFSRLTLSPSKTTSSSVFPHLMLDFN